MGGRQWTRNHPATRPGDGPRSRDDHRLPATLGSGRNARLSTRAAFGAGRFWYPAGTPASFIDRIVGVDARRNRVARTLEAFGPQRVAFGGGAVWGGGDDGVSRFDFATGRIRRVARHTGPVYLSVDVSYGRGAAWAVSGRQLLRISPVGRVVRRILLPGLGVAVLATGADVGVASSGRLARLWRIDARRNRLVGEMTIPVANIPGSSMNGLAAGRGLVWVSSESAFHAVRPRRR